MLTGLGSSNNAEPPKTDGDRQARKSDNAKDGEILKKLGLFAVVVGDLVGLTGAGIAVGYLAWTKLNAPWWVLLLCVTTGLSLAIFQLYKISQKEQ